MRKLVYRYGHNDMITIEPMGEKRPAGGVMTANKLFGGKQGG
jgi:hypothetical protein